MNCIKHNHLEASGMCVLCRRPGCSSCLIEISGKYQCRECLSQLTQNGDSHIQKQSREYQFYPNTMDEVSENKSVGMKFLWVLLLIYFPFVGIFVWEKGPFQDKDKKAYLVISWFWTAVLFLSFVIVISEGVTK